MVIGSREGGGQGSGTRRDGRRAGELTKLEEPARGTGRGISRGDPLYIVVDEKRRGCSCHGTKGGELRRIGDDGKGRLRGRRDIYMREKPPLRLTGKGVKISGGNPAPVRGSKSTRKHLYLLGGPWAEVGRSVDRG